MEQMAALKYATTHLEATYALVTVDTQLILTIICAMVRVILTEFLSFILVLFRHQ